MFLRSISAARNLPSDSYKARLILLVRSARFTSGFETVVSNRGSEAEVALDQNQARCRGGRNVRLKSKVKKPGDSSAGLFPLFLPTPLYLEGSEAREGPVSGRSDIWLSFCAGTDVFRHGKTTRAPIETGPSHGRLQHCRPVCVFD